MAEKRKSPAFQFYPKDFLTDKKVLLMSPEALGHYIKLLCIDWLEDGLEESEIHDLIGGVSDSPIVKQLIKCFVQHPRRKGRITNNRLEKERNIQIENRKKREEQIESRWPDNREKRGRELRSSRLSDARKKGKHTKEQWDSIVAFHGGICCRCNASEGALVKDHIVPIYQGGSDGIENIQPLCSKCNSAKGSENEDFRKVGWRNIEAIQRHYTGILMPVDASSSSSSSSSSANNINREKKPKKKRIKESKYNEFSEADFPDIPATMIASLKAWVEFKAKIGTPCLLTSYRAEVAEFTNQPEFFTKLVSRAIRKSWKGLNEQIPFEQATSGYSNNGKSKHEAEEARIEALYQKALAEDLANETS